MRLILDPSLISDALRHFSFMMFNWVFNLLMFFALVFDQIDSREIASIILFCLLVAYASRNDWGIVKSFGIVVETALDRKIVIPAALLIGWSLLLVSLFAICGLWTRDLLLDTLIEVAFVGLPSLYISANAKSVTSIAKELIAPEMKVGALAAFYFGLCVLPLPFELILQALIFILVLAPTVSKKREASSLANILLGVIGIALLLWTAFNLLSDPSHFNWKNELRSFFMAIWYPIGMAPFVVLLGYYASFEKLYFRIKGNGVGASIPVFLCLCSGLFPSFFAINHMCRFEYQRFEGCHGWMGKVRFCSNWKREICIKRKEAFAKVDRMERGKGKCGYDEDGLWLDWTNLEKIKNALWYVASMQNNNWNQHGSYTDDVSFASHVPRGCNCESYISPSRDFFACWMSNATGFTFGIALANGSFPFLRYEGSCPPEIDPNHPDSLFVRDQEEGCLPNWYASFKVDESLL